ncbi:MAG: toll/interleukin-1 receptor domain-containing protein [bacterium]
MEDNPIKVFISYSWDSEEHKKWVLQLADKLSQNNIYVILDQYDITPGKNLDFFVEDSIKIANKVLIILTENYALKADNRVGGVGQEYSIIRSDISQDLKIQILKYIPVLREGDLILSCPSFLRPLIRHDMRNNDLFDETFDDLIRFIYEKPKVERPLLGPPPDFIN